MKQGYVMALGYGELTEKRLVSKVIQISCLGHSPLSPFIICYCLLFYLLLYFFLLFFKNPVVIVFMCRAPTSLNCVVSEIYHSSFCKTSHGEHDWCSKITLCKGGMEREGGGQARKKKSVGWVLG